MHRKEAHFAIALFAVCSLLLATLPNAASIATESAAGSHIAAVSHDPFVIIGDANFSDTASAEGWSGDGSPGSPYIIENLDIDLGPSPIAAINITGTSVHFIIRGCHLSGPLATPSYGVYLDNVANGRIDDTHCNDFSHGIYIENGCSDITASNNNCSENSYGIYIESSVSNTVINNICNLNFFYGILINASNSNTVANNICNDNLIYHGIFLHSSNFSIVNGNTCNDNDDYGAYLYNCNSSIANDNICNLNDYGLYLRMCNNSIVNRNTCNQNAFSGIYLLRSHSSSAANNTCNSNREGMYIQEMESNSVTGNTCFNNSLRGIALQVCDLTNLTFNTISNTTIQFGLYLDGLSDNNAVTWNVLVHNLFNCVDDGIGNVFNYNYWSDYSGVDDDEDGIGDTAYVFTTTNSDPNPLMYYPWAPEWKQMPTDQVIELGGDFEYLVEFTFISLTAPFDLSVSDSTNFAVHGPSAADHTRRYVITNVPNLPVNSYPLAVKATNIYGFITEGSFTLSVVDTTPPVIEGPVDISYTKGESLPSIHWLATDLSNISYIVLLDGSELTSYDAISTSISFTMILEDKEPGLYNYTMVVEDESGNVAVDTVMVTVHPVPLLEALLPFLIVGAVAIIVILVAFVAFRRRRAS